MAQSDVELLQACRNGQATAWEMLVQRYQKLIYTIPRRAGLNEDDAAEIFQEVFTTLLEKLDLIEQPDRLQAWLVTTAKRKTWRLISRQHGRHQRAETSPGADETDEFDLLATLPDPAPLADEVLTQLSEQHRVRCALEEIDERCRRLLQMLFYAPEPPAYSAIALALGISEGSVGPTRARCLEKLKRSL